MVGPGVAVVEGVAEVGVSGGADQDEGSWWVVGVGGEGVGPSAFVFEAVVGVALGLEVVFAGGAGGVGDDVVEVAVGGGALASGGAAGDVAGADVVGQCGWWAVGLTSVVE